MGLSASQARLLSITARITDNELRSQFITNSKMRLADDSSQASADYMAALNSTKLMFSSYDANGAKTSDNLTAGLLMTYGPLKNQYGLTNNSGQMMVSSLDAQNYANSTNLIDFLKCYGVQPQPNPKFIDLATNLFGADYDKFLQWNADGSLNTTAMQDAMNLDSAFNAISTVGYRTSGDTGRWMIGEDESDDQDENNTISEADYNNFADMMDDWYGQVSLPNGVSNDYDTLANSGVFGSLINTLNSYPGWMGTVPGDAGYWQNLNFSDPTMYPKFQNATLYCYTNAMGGNTGCYLHVLANLLTAGTNYGNSETFTTTTGNSITTGGYGGIDQGITQTYVDILANAGITVSGTQAERKQDQIDVSNALKDPYLKAMPNQDQYNDIMQRGWDNLSLGEKLRYQYTKDATTGEIRLKTMEEKIKDTYYIVNDANNDPPNYNGTLGFNNNDASDSNSIRKILLEFENDMANAFNVPAYAAQSYQDDLMAYQYRCDDFTTWMNNSQAITDNYKAMLDTLAKTPPEICNQDDPKAQWYTNLWYRMGGIDEASKQNPSNNFAVLDDNKISNADYLQYALETGILAMEQVVFSDTGSALYPGMKQADWKSCNYDNATDITRQDDTLAVSKAEAKYQQALNDIQAKDKKYDLDLKKLDTQHNALQTEFDSVKTIISKNVERSFKAFS